MKNTMIKIADLLKETNKTDTIEFKEVTVGIDGLSKKGVSGNLHLTSFNHDTIEASFTDITCDKEDICEKCSKKFIRSIRCDLYEATYTNNSQAYEDEPADEIFPIDANKIIDTHDALEQAITLQQPVTILCYDCINDEPEDDSDEPEDYFEASNSIKFH